MALSMRVLRVGDTKQIETHYRDIGWSIMDK